MEVTQPSLPFWVQSVAWALAALVLAWQGRPLWRRLHGAGPEAVRVLLGLALVLMAVRWFNTAPLQGVMLHLTGATIATLLVGAGPACWVMAVASLSGVLMGAAWHGWAMDFLVTGALPVAVTAVFSRAVRRWLPHNIVVYVMGNAFFAAAVAMAASVLAKFALVAWLGSRSAAAYLVATPLLALAEAFLTGTLMAVIVVYRPQWCVSFDDKVYLWPERPM
ncbi:energy-coupling factor ABC transporter permease [Luteimonas sp. A277]